MKEILYVDDEELLRELAKEYLPMVGYKLETAENGEEAVNIVIKYNNNHKKFDLIIMDLNMPIMNGYEANKRILDMIPDQKIIVSTGKPNQELVFKCKDLGLSNILKKPYTLSGLANCIEYAINPLGDRS